LVEKVVLGIVQRHPDEASGSMHPIRDLGHRDVRKLLALTVRGAADEHGGI
jgi:hypothetical protein